MANNWAITIGVNHYEHLHEADHLNYAVRDAERVKEFLCNQAGFAPDNVLLCSDNSEPIRGGRQIPTRPTLSNLRRLLLDEIKIAEGADNIWFFFSGHGMLGKDNHDYLMPRDGNPRDSHTTISVDFIIRCLMNCQAKNVVMTLDMCRRSDGSKGNNDVGAHTAEIAKQKGIITIFSCQRGEKSYEIQQLQQGAFTYALLEGLAKHGTPKTLEQYLQRRVPELNRQYGKPDQVPLFSLEPASKYDFCLLANLSKQLSTASVAIFDENISVSSTHNVTAENLGDSLNQKFVSVSISGAELFNFEVVTVDVQGNESSRYQAQSQQLTVDLGDSVTLEMVVIPGGTFVMGCPESERRRYPNEVPAHPVRIKPFLISKCPITQVQWKAIASLPQVSHKLKLRPSRLRGDNRPVEQVSWLNAVEFCTRLSKKTGHEYRLPTEAEWEYACRAGTTTPFHFGETITTELANYDGSFTYRSELKGINRGKTIPVKSFPFANGFGLFDMHGNVWEWCLDHWHDNYDNAPTTEEVWLTDTKNQARVIRGGSWRNEPPVCRSSSRRDGDANRGFNDTSFRVVRFL